MEDNFQVIFDDCEKVVQTFRLLFCWVLNIFRAVYFNFSYLSAYNNFFNSLTRDSH